MGDTVVNSDHIEPGDRRRIAAARWRPGSIPWTRQIVIGASINRSERQQKSRHRLQIGKLAEIN